MKRVLIANRGEIAVRVIRACRELGLESVAVFSDADAESLHVKLADRAYRLGSGPAVHSYLRVDRILQVAERAGADAVHPGYGLLSENANFAQAVLDAGLIFVGPPPAAIRTMGDKIAARRQMIQARIPVVPGSRDPLASAQEGLQKARSFGFPVLIKAVAGGGGRGMRMVARAEDFAEAFESASREAQAAFSEGSLYLEKFIENPRHIEIQVLADTFGRVIHLGERECSVQRRYQKVIEEAPSCAVSAGLRREMGAVAIKAAQAVDYVGAGTVEFLLDHQKKFYFMEMNTRLQVEHPITEWVSGIDLVAEQLRIAAGEKIRFPVDDFLPRGAAIECRICAEDPEENFRPCPGIITSVRFPGGPGIRVDTGIYAGYEIPIYYDAMFCKLTAWGNNREAAIRRMQGALKEFQIQGIKTNIPLLQKVLAHPEFQSGDYHIHILPRIMGKEPAVVERKAQERKLSLEEIAAMAAALSQFQRRQGGIESAPMPSPQEKSLSPWKLPAQSWKLAGLQRMMGKGF